ncbi:MAG TPA: CBS domain-containing protein [Burkholderiaceae bacterium]|nr:CBS domain-containing protein [Burkholderiaceae bacterium]
MKVSDILRVKGNALFTVTPDSTLPSAIQSMAENDIGSVVVMDHGELVGILTFREVINTVHRYGEQFSARSVRELMVQGPLTVGPDTDVNEVRRIMLDQHARYMPVTEGRTLIGVISFYDVARAVYEEQSFENRMLKAYIRDWPEQESVNG